MRTLRNRTGRSTTPSSTPRTLSPQGHLVLEYLRSGRGLSSLIALNVLGIGSLSSRIAELRKKGFNIIGDRRCEPSPVRRTYIVYKLVEPTRIKREPRKTTKPKYGWVGLEK